MKSLGTEQNTPPGWSEIITSQPFHRSRFPHLSAVRCSVLFLSLSSPSYYEYGRKAEIPLIRPPLRQPADEPLQGCRNRPHIYKISWIYCFFRTAIFFYVFPESLVATFGSVIFNDRSSHLVALSNANYAALVNGPFVCFAATALLDTEPLLH